VRSEASLRHEQDLKTEPSDFYTKLLAGKPRVEMLLEFGAYSQLAKSEGGVFCITQPYMKLTLRFFCDFVPRMARFIY
jgi:hypothetical protein